MRKVLILLGVPIDDLTMDEALQRLDDFIAVGRATGRSHQVATINADFVVNALKDLELQRILQEADMTTADGMPLVWGARTLGVPLEGRVTGADLVPTLAARAAEKGHSIYLLGARPGVAARAAAILQARHPGLNIVGTASPPNRSVLEMDRSVLEEVQAARPDILLVAFGNPKQEKWISMHLHELGVPVSIGIGGTLDLIAGVTRRAPRWMQQIGLEWLYRLLQEPRRLWKRYVHDLLYFGSFFARQAWIMRRGQSPQTLLPTSDSDSIIIDNRVILNVHGRVDITNRAALVQRAEEALARTPFLILNLAHVEFFDSAALGSLVTLANQARAAGGALWLAGVPPHIHQIFTATRLERFFDIYADVETVLKLAHTPTEPFIEPEEDHAGWQVLKMPRRLDTTTTAAMVETCMQRMEQNPHLILDFSETVFLASAGMAAMIRIERVAREQGGELRISGCSRDVQHTLEMVRLDSMFALFPNVPTATAPSAPQAPRPVEQIAAANL